VPAAHMVHTEPPVDAANDPTPQVTQLVDPVFP
jgi:hypothetical protein